MDKNFNLQQFVISVVLIGIVLVIGIYITSEIGNVTDNGNLASFSIANESGFINSTGYTLAGYSSDNFVITSIVVLNATDNTTILSGNYSISTLGVVTNATEVEYEEALFSYDYTTGSANSDDASLAAADVTAALATGTAWIAILVVVGFAVVILTMLTSGLGSAARKEEEIPYY
jgi:hypothetical protein